MSEGARQEGLVKEILTKGDLSAGEIREELKVKDVCFVKSYDRACNGLFLALMVLWLLPAIAQWTGWGLLSFFAQLPRVDFPMAVIVVGAAFFVVAVALEVQLCLMRRKRGGCHDTHETVVIIKEGPYRVVRHPGYLVEIVYFSVLPIVLSVWIPFTITALLAIVIAIAAIAYLIRVEDRFNLRKWGEEYRQYMQEVPAIDFVTGLKRRSRGGAS
jgi:protein-S-isoprenylcysteine O-methyltransferase Ste14